METLQVLTEQEMKLVRKLNGVNADFVQIMSDENYNILTALLNRAKAENRYIVIGKKFISSVTTSSTGKKWVGLKDVPITL